MDDSPNAPMSPVQPGPALSGIETFRCLQVHMAVLTPEDDPTLPAPQVCLQMTGIPAHITDGEKHYVTFLTVDTIAALGKEFTEAAEQLAKAGSPILTATSMDDVKSLADAADRLRSPR